MHQSRNFLLVAGLLWILFLWGILLFLDGRFVWGVLFLPTVPAY